MLNQEQLRCYSKRDWPASASGRRDFLRLLAGMTAAGTMFLTTSMPTVRAAPAPEKNLPKRRCFAMGDFNDEPASFDVNKDLYCNCEFMVFAGLMRFTPTTLPCHGWRNRSNPMPTGRYGRFACGRTPNGPMATGDGARLRLVLETPT